MILSRSNGPLQHAGGEPCPSMGRTQALFKYQCLIALIAEPNRLESPINDVGSACKAPPDVEIIEIEPIVACIWQ